MSDAAKSFDIPANSLSVLHNSFDDLITLFSERERERDPATFLDLDFSKIILFVYQHQHDKNYITIDIKPTPPFFRVKISAIVEVSAVK